jgi:hypothetical protein
MKKSFVSIIIGLFSSRPFFTGENKVHYLNGSCSQDLKKLVNTSNVGTNGKQILYYCGIDNHQRGQSPKGTIIKGDNHQRGQSSKGTIIKGDNHPWGQSSKGTIIEVLSTDLNS